jgi:hypothetical protein
VFSRQAILHNSRSFAQFLSNPGKKKSHPRPGGNCRLLLGLATSDQSSAG